MSKRARLIVTVVILVVVAVGGGVLAYLLAFGGVSSSVNCMPGDSAPVCSPEMETVVALLPMAGWAAAVGCCGWAVVRVIRSERGVGGPLITGFAIMAATMLVATSLWRH